MAERSGSRLYGPEEAVAALRSSAGRVDGNCVCILVSDAGRRVTQALAVAGVRAADVLETLDLMLSPRPAAVVVGIFRPGSSTFLGPAEEALAEAVRHNSRVAGVEILDVIVVSGHRWRSIPPAMGLPAGRAG